MIKYITPPAPLCFAVLLLLQALSLPLAAQTVDVSLEEIDSGYVYLNQLRQRAGMLPFMIDQTLEDASQNHSDYLAINLRSGHGEDSNLEGFTGSTPADRVVFAGYNAQPGENVSTGSTEVEDSIDGLMGAIYHRFGFLTFDHDEIGIGIAASSGQGFYTYNSGNSGINNLCGNTNDANAGFFNVCASNPSLVVEADAYFQATINIESKNPEIIVWPVQGETDFPPAFFEESPDPLPDFSVSGNPLSIQFNPLHFSSVTLESFRLFNHETGEEITNTRLLDSASDPNARFSELEFALFPLDRLDWNTAYRAKAVYSSDSGSGTLEWAFRTRKPDIPLLVLEENGELLSIPANYESFIVYVPPTLGFERLGGVSFPGFIEVQYLWGDNNILQVSHNESAGAQFTINSTEGAQFTVALSSPATLLEKEDVSLSVEGTTSEPGQVEQVIAEFNPASGELILPHVQVGSSKVLSATLSLTDANPIRFSLSGTGIADITAQSALYDPVTQTVNIPQVQVGDKLYAVTLTLISSDFDFELGALQLL